MDLNKACDTIDDQLLLRKYYGGIQHRRFERIIYQTRDNKYYVKYNNNVSIKLDSVYAVPQGSILGSLYYITVGKIHMKTRTTN